MKIAIDKKDGKQVSCHPFKPNSFWYKLWAENMVKLGHKII